jgi:hypothetical protein
VLFILTALLLSPIYLMGVIGVILAWRGKK